MSNCLLCGQAMKNKTRFSDLIFFSKEKSGICEECFSTFEEIAEQHCPHCYKMGNRKVARIVSTGRIKGNQLSTQLCTNIIKRWRIILVATNFKETMF